MNIPNTSNAEITSDIYLPGNLSQDNKIYLPLSSSAIVFVVQYCCTSKFKVFFTNRPTSNEYRVQLPSSILGTLAHSFVEYTEVPSLVQNCHLPVVHDKRDNLIRSGLCSAVRHIVQAANDEQPNAKFSELLVSDAISYSLSESSWFERITLPEILYNFCTLYPNEGHLHSRVFIWRISLYKLLFFLPPNPPTFCNFEYRIGRCASTIGQGSTAQPTHKIHAYTDLSS